MENVPDQGTCYFSDLSVFEDSKRELTSAFKNSDFRGVTVNKMSEDVIVFLDLLKALRI